MEARVQQELAIFDPIQAGLDQLRAEAYNLRVLSIEDREGYKLIKSFRTKSVSKLATAVEEKRKELKSFYLEAGREIDGRAKEIISELREIADYCKSQEAIIDNEEARIKAEAEALIKAVVEQRQAKLRAVNYYVDVFLLKQLETMEEEDFTLLLNREQVRFDEEAKAKALKEAELERLKKIEAEQELRLSEERNKAAAAQQAMIQLQQKQLKKEADRITKLEAEASAREHERLEKEKILLNNKLEAEAKARSEAANQKAFDEVRKTFPTIEACWVEIVRLKELLSKK